jgi:hypothetical protein
MHKILRGLHRDVHRVSGRGEGAIASRDKQLCSGSADKQELQFKLEKAVDFQLPKIKLIFQNCNCKIE